MKNREPYTKVQLKLLQREHEQLLEEFKVVNWYIQVFEEGRNTKTLLNDFIVAQEEIRQLKENMSKRESKLLKKLTKKTIKLKETKEQLVKLNKEVVKPLIEEVRIKELLNQRLLEQQAINAYDLKMFNSVIRTPRLCDEFHKALRRKFEIKKLKAQEMDCFIYLKD